MALSLLWPMQAGEGGEIYATHTVVDQAVEAARVVAPASAGFVNAVLRRFVRERDALVTAALRDPQVRHGHPRWWIERLRGNRALSAALSAITAAVVGVILNLAVWFGIHTLFEQVREVPFAAGTIDLPVLTSVNWPALALAVGAILAMFRFKAGMLPVLGVCSVLGAAYVMII